MEGQKPEKSRDLAPEIGLWINVVGLGAMGLMILSRVGVGEDMFRLFWWINRVAQLTAAGILMGETPATLKDVLDGKKRMTGNPKRWENWAVTIASATLSLLATG